MNFVSCASSSTLHPCDSVGRSFVRSFVWSYCWTSVASRLASLFHCSHKERRVQVQNWIDQYRNAPEKMHFDELGNKKKSNLLTKGAQGLSIHSVKRRTLFYTFPNCQEVISGLILVPVKVCRLDPQVIWYWFHIWHAGHKTQGVYYLSFALGSSAPNSLLGVRQIDNISGTA